MRRGLLAAVHVSIVVALAAPFLASAFAAPSCTISTPPGTAQPGYPVRLLWFTQDTASAAISSIGQIPSSLLPQGHMDVYPSGTTVYTMTVSNSTGSRTCSVVVNIASQQTYLSYSSSASSQSVAQAFSSSQIYYAPIVFQASSYSSSIPLWTTNYGGSSAYSSSYGSSYDPYAQHYYDLYDAADPEWDPYYSSDYYPRYSSYDLPPTPSHDSLGYFTDNFFGNGNSYDPYSDPYNNSYSDPYQNDTYWNDQPQYYPQDGTGAASGYGDPYSTGYGGWWDNRAPATNDTGWSNGGYYYGDEIQQPTFQYDTPDNTPQPFEDNSYNEWL